MIHNKTITQIHQDLTTKQYSCTELVTHFLDRIDKYDRDIKSIITVCRESALTKAAAFDAKGNLSLGQGIPLIHKDILCTKNIKTSCASKMLDNFISPYDAFLVRKLDDAGFITIAKANMDEFAMGSSNERSYYNNCLNPWDLERVPGGSSGGSAASIAAKLAPCSTGTDTGGSIRQPASYCGVSGLKPTYGRVSRFGLIAFASSLDQAGPMAKNIEDLAILLQHMAGYDHNDSTSVNISVPNYQESLKNSIKGKKLGLPKEFMSSDLNPKIGKQMEEFIQALQKLGAEIIDISLPHATYSVPTYYIIASSECSSNLARFDGVRYGHRAKEAKDLLELYSKSRGEGFGAEVKRRIMLGTYALSTGYYDAYYIKAQQIRRLIRDDYINAFKTVDAIISPTTPSTAFKVGEKLDDPISMYLSDIYTVGVNLAGLPAVSLPIGFVDKLPIGGQIIGKHFEEATILNIGHQYQLHTNWHTYNPTYLSNKE